jgi:hypothetical protein
VDFYCDCVERFSEDGIFGREDQKIAEESSRYGETCGCVPAIGEMLRIMGYCSEAVFP